MNGEGDVGHPAGVVGSRDPRRHLVERWGDALARRDADEVERLVRQGHADRVDVASSAWLGTMAGAVVAVDGSEVPT